MFRKLTASIKEFVQNQHGTTTIEFLLVMPLIMFWIGGTLTFFNAFSEYTKSVKATYTVADILSRQTAIDDDYIDSMNNLFANFMNKSTNDVWLRVSSIAKVNDDFTVDWSTATGIHNPLEASADIPKEIIPDLLDEESIILVESHTPFVPFLDYIGIDSNTYISRVVVSPRFSSQLANSDG
jgi:hypothetical protein